MVFKFYFDIIRLINFYIVKYFLRLNVKNKL